MKIKLSAPNQPQSTIIETEHDVTIAEAFVGPIFRTADGACLAVMMRDDGFELNCWRGPSMHNEPLPPEAVRFTVDPERGVAVFL